MITKTRLTALAVLFIAVLLIAACAPAGAPEAADTPVAEVPAEGQLYGAELTLTSATPLSEMLAGPEPFVGKVVQIKGTAVHVCKHSGKRLRVMDPETEKAIMVDFSEVGLEFPAETVNHTIIAEGTLVRRDLAPASVEAGGEHADHADKPEGEGENCAAEEADADETRHVYVIAGTGARDLDL